MRHLVFKGRDTEGPLSAVRFRDVGPPYRRRVVATRFEPVQKALKIGLQVRLILGRRYAVDTGRSILPGPAECLPHPVHVNQVMQRVEHPFRVIPRLRGYPLSFR